MEPMQALIKAIKEPVTREEIRAALTADEFALITMTCDSVTSDHSKRAYQRALEDFFWWYKTRGRPGLSKALIRGYAAELKRDGATAQNVNQRLCAIRKFASEAGDNQMMPEHVARAIQTVKGFSQAGERLGNWLTRDEAQALLNAIDRGDNRGLRDLALIATLIGCGLRRAEAAELTFEHVQQREGRWVIVDICGKGEKTRSVPMPSWTKCAIDMWSSALRLSSGAVFRPVNRGDRIAGEQMTPQAIGEVITKRSRECGVWGISAHDLRRTFAKLARLGGSEIEQIQLSLGHASIKTTQVYLGTEQQLTDAPGDKLGLRI